MIPEKVLVATVVGKFLVIEGREDALFYIIASPFATGLEAGPQRMGVNSVMLETKGQDGVIAIAVYYKKTTYNWLLEVIHEDEEGLPRVNLKRSWCPKHVLAQVERPDLSVIIDGVRFSTEEDDLKKGGYRYVPDRALMARFVYDQASAEEVKASASEYVEEVSAREKLKEVVDACNTISKKLEKAEADAKYHEENAQKTRHALDCASVCLNKHVKEIAETEEVLKDLRGFFMTASGLLLAKVKLEGDDKKILIDLYDTIVLKHHRILRVPEPTV